MLPSIFRSLVFLVQAVSLLSPLLGKGRRQKLPGLLKEATFLVITNKDLIWKLIEKQRWTIDAMKKVFKSKIK